MAQPDARGTRYVVDGNLMLALVPRSHVETQGERSRIYYDGRLLLSGSLAMIFVVLLQGEHSIKSLCKALEKDYPSTNDGVQRLGIRLATKESPYRLMRTKIIGGGPTLFRVSHEDEWRRR